MKRLLQLATNPAVWVTGLLLLILLLSFAWCESDKRRKAAVAEGRVAESQADLGRKAAETSDRQAGNEAENRKLDAENRDDIMGADNAKEDAGDAGERGLRALCRRVQYRDDPRCARL